MDRVTTSTTEAMAVDCETPAPSFASAFAQQGTVALLIGLHEEPLVAHECFLTLNSEFFEAAMKKAWAEGQTRVIKLPEDDLATMTDYLNFTYTRYLPSSDLINGGPAPFYSDWESLAKLYVLGERTLDKCIRNAIVSEILRISEIPDKKGRKQFVSPAACNILFDGTPDTSPIRRMIVDQHVFHGQKDWLDTEDHPAMILEVARAFLERAISRQSYEEYRGRQIKAEDYFV